MSAARSSTEMRLSLLASPASSVALTCRSCPSVRVMAWVFRSHFFPFYRQFMRNSRNVGQRVVAIGRKRCCLGKPHLTIGTAEGEGDSLRLVHTVFGSDPTGERSEGQGGGRRRHPGADHQVRSDRIIRSIGVDPIEIALVITCANDECLPNTVEVNSVGSRNAYELRQTVGGVPSPDGVGFVT